MVFLLGIFFPFFMENKWIKFMEKKSINKFRSNPVARRWYKSRRWGHFRRQQLAEKPLCERCGEVANVADHRVPHKGDERLFFDPRNLTSLCKRCHDSWKAKKENGRIDTACGEDGRPTDPNHPWNC